MATHLPHPITPGPPLYPHPPPTPTVVSLLALDVRCCSTSSDDDEQQLSDMSATSVMSSAERYALSTFLTVLSVAGTIGNGVVLWVFWARRERVVATLFIVVLATLDLITSLVVVPFTVFMEMKEFDVGYGLDGVCKLYWVNVQLMFGNVCVCVCVCVHARVFCVYCCILFIRYTRYSLYCIICMSNNLACLIQPRANT